MSKDPAHIYKILANYQGHPYVVVEVTGPSTLKVLGNFGTKEAAQAYLDKLNSKPTRPAVE